MPTFSGPCRACEAAFVADYKTNRPAYCPPCRLQYESLRSRRRVLSRNPEAKTRPYSATAEHKAATKARARAKEKARRQARSLALASDRKAIADARREQRVLKSAAQKAEKLAARQRQREAERAAKLAERPWLAGKSAAERNRLRLRHDPDYAVRERLRIQGRKRHQLRNLEYSVRKSLGTNRMGPVYRAVLGYDAGDLRQHLEAKFSAGMSWAAFMAGEIHIDHIKPVAAFDLDDPEQVRAAWALTNLQPMWARDNLRKGARFGKVDLNPRNAS